MARQVELVATSLDALARRSAAGAWMPERCRQWQSFWQHKIGRSHVCLFDVMAAAFILVPGQFRWADLHVWLGRDPLLGPFQRGRALEAEHAASAPATGSVASSACCLAVSGDLQQPRHKQRVADPPLQKKRFVQNPKTLPISEIALLLVAASSAAEFGVHSSSANNGVTNLCCPKP